LAGRIGRSILSGLLIAVTIALSTYAVLDHLVGAVQATDSGVQGTAWVGPVSPVQKAGDASEQVYANAWILVKDAAGRTVATAVSDKAGLYRVALSPGNYTLSPQPPVGSALPRGADVVAEVVKGRFTRLDVHYDSGIR